MQDLVNALMAEFGMSEDKVRAALGALLKLIEQHAADQDFADLLAGLPGADALLAGAKLPEGKRGGLFGSSGRLGGALSGALGGRGGLMATAAELQKQGVGLDRMRPFITRFVDHAEQRVGPELVERVASAIPGLEGLRARG